MVAAHAIMRSEGRIDNKIQNRNVAVDDWSCWTMGESLGWIKMVERLYNGVIQEDQGKQNDRAYD